MSSERWVALGSRKCQQIREKDGRKGCQAYGSPRGYFVRPRKGVIDLIPREKLWGKSYARRERYAVCPLFVARRQWNSFVARFRDIQIILLIILSLRIYYFIITIKRIKDKPCCDEGDEESFISLQEFVFVPRVKHNKNEATNRALFLLLFLCNFGSLIRRFARLVWGTWLRQRNAKFQKWMRLVNLRVRANTKLEGRNVHKVDCRQSLVSVPVMRENILLRPVRRKRRVCAEWSVCHPVTQNIPRISDILLIGRLSRGKHVAAHCRGPCARAIAAKYLIVTARKKKVHRVHRHSQMFPERIDLRGFLIIAIP